MSRERAIFYKHRNQKLYSGTHFAVAETLTLLPFNVFDAMVFGNLLYWMCGMARDLEAWAIFMTIGIMYAVCMNQHAAMFAYALPNESASFTCAVMFILLYMVFAGAIATPDVIPNWLKWMYWINPQAWGYQALAINEFRTAKYNNQFDADGNPFCTYLGQKVSMSCGQFYLKNRQFQTDDTYLWGAMAVIGGWIVLAFCMQCYALNYFNYEVPHEVSEDADYDPSEADLASPRWFKGEPEERDATQQLIDVVQDDFELDIDCTPTTFSFENIDYLVPAKDDPSKDYYILNNVTGWAKPYKMTALMGASGAGKTTLLDVLAGRKTEGECRGTIALNGHTMDPKEFANSVGYVEQFGCHNETSTVMEALQFSATLRNGVEPAIRDKFVQQVARMLELDGILGNKLVLHTSIEENKRLTIGVEVVANPAVLFLDEPTSGLDARAAMIVMKSMKRIADTGRTILATIHQPNIDIFNKFDGLLLLGKDGSVDAGGNTRGGYPVFFKEDLGCDQQDLVDYFSVSENKLQENYNPATWMLEVIMEDKSQNWIGFYERSQLGYENLSTVREMGEATKSAPIPDAYTAPMLVQFGEVLWRAVIQYWRSPSFSFARLFVIFFVSGLVALIFEQQEYTNAAAVQSRCSVVAFMVMLGGIYNLYTMIPFFTAQRSVFYRERSSGMYTNSAYVFSTWVELPYLVLETLIGVNTMYWLIGFQSATFPWLYYNLVYFLYVAAQTTMGMVLSAMMPNVMASQLVAALFVNICSLFAGTSVPYDHIPSYYKWLFWFSPQKWAQEGALTTQFYGDTTHMCVPLGVPCPSCSAKVPKDYPLGICTADGNLGHVTGYVAEVGDYVLNNFLHGYRYDFRFYDVMVLGCWFLVARAVLLILIHNVSHLKR